LVVNSLIFMVIGLNGYYLYPSQFIAWGTPTPAEAFAYEVSSGAIGTTSTGEFLPRWAQQHPQPETLWPDYAAGRLPQKLDPATLPPGVQAEAISHQAEADLLRIRTPEPFTATLRTLYWPGWQLYLDGQAVSLTITPKTGLIQARIPAGDHTLRLQLESTPLRTAGLWLTGLAGGILGAVILFTLFGRRMNSTLQPEGRMNSALQPVTHYALRIMPPLSPQFFILTALALIALYLFSRPLASTFVLRSDPNRPQPADQVMQVDFSDQIRLVGVEALPEIVPLPAAGETEVEVVLYWRALRELETNYSVFLHLDGPNGQTYATVDEENPEDIPTRNWPPGLYLRNPLRLKLPAGLPPVRYELTTGLYRRDTGERLAIQPEGETSFPLGSLWLASSRQKMAPAVKLATFGPHLSLYQAELTGNTLRLLWQTGQHLDQNYSIFVHALDHENKLLSQTDGVPYEGLYPLPDWLPGQPVEDVRSLELKPETKQIAIGVYDPATGRRLPALGPDGRPLPDDNLIIPVSHEP
jgi:hypothetical protein